VEFDVQHHAAQRAWKGDIVMYFMSKFTSITGRELRTCHLPPLYRVYESDKPHCEEVEVYVAVYYNPKDPIIVKSMKNFEHTVSGLLRQKTEAFDNVLTGLTDKYAAL